MEFLRVLPLRGPNQWAWFPVLEAWVDLGAWAGRTTASRAGCAQRLLDWLPGLSQHGCASGEPGAFARRLREGADFAHVLEHVTLELQGLAGDDLSFGKSRETSRAGVFRVVVRYHDEDLAYECLKAARQLTLAAAEGREPDLEGTLRRLRECAAKNLPLPACAALIRAARRRRIPWYRPDKSGLLVLGMGSRQRRVRGGETDRTGAVACSVAEDRDLTRTLLQGAGVPVAPGYAATSVEEAWETAEDYVGLPVTVRPHFGVTEAGVTENLTTRDEVEAAYRTAREESSSVVVEQYVEGPRFRLLVVGRQVLGVLGALDAGEVHPETQRHAADAANAVGLDIAAVEVVARDLAAPLGPQGGVVRQVYGAPGLDAFVTASGDGGRALGDAIVGLLFPGAENGRIPIAAVTGTNGKTTVTRLLARLLEGGGRRIGLTCTDGVYFRGRRIVKGDCSGPTSARNLLLNPMLDAAVLETARGGILRGGLAFTECQVAVVTNIAGGDHLGLGDVHTVEELAAVKRMIVEVVSREGAAVLNAADPLAAAMAEHCDGRVIFFALDGTLPVIRKHRESGGQALFIRGHRVVVADGAAETEWMDLNDVAVTRNGSIPFEVENALAAMGAALGLGVEREAIAARAAGFQPGLETVPTRFNVFEKDGATVVVDFGHNVDALRAVIEALAGFPHERRVAVFSASGDRRDQDIEEMGALLGGAFDRVVLYEDTDMYERAPGSVIALLRRGLARGARVREVEELQGGLNAFRYAWESVRRGELLLAQAHLADPAVEFLQSRQAG